jgi:hypothetical protein
VEWQLHTRRRQNLKSHLVNLFKEATLRYVRTFKALRIEGEKVKMIYFYQIKRRKIAEGEVKQLLKRAMNAVLMRQLLRYVCRAEQSHHLS